MQHGRVTCLNEGLTAFTAGGETVRTRKRKMWYHKPCYDTKTSMLFVNVYTLPTLSLVQLQHITIAFTIVLLTPLLFNSL